MKIENLYETDFYAWCIQQSLALSERQHDKLDWENLAEEIDSMSRRERKELRNRLKLIFCHLIKMKCQPNYENKKSWINTIEEQRYQINCLCKKDSPSLQYCIDEISIRSYEEALKMAEREMGFCPSLKLAENISLEKALTEGWFPNE